MSQETSIWSNYREGVDHRIPKKVPHQFNVFIHDDDKMRGDPDAIDQTIPVLVPFPLDRWRVWNQPIIIRVPVSSSEAIKIQSNMERPVAMQFMKLSPF